MLNCTWSATGCYQHCSSQDRETHCKEDQENKDGWVFVQVFGDFMMMRSSIFEHYVIPWAKGNRISCVFWIHKGMFDRQTLAMIQTGRPVARPREQLPIVMQTGTSLPELMVRLQTGPQELVARLRLNTPTCLHPNLTWPRLTWTLQQPRTYKRGLRGSTRRTASTRTRVRTGMTTRTRSTVIENLWETRTG
jgi:hypothetical protein